MKIFGEVSKYDIKGKCICHCSGAMSSSVFNDITGHGASGYSIHPLCAVSSKENSYRNFSNVFFSVEGSDKYRESIISWLRAMGNPVSHIASDRKVLYHAAAVFASNLVIGLYKMGTTLLSECGFTPEEAEHALRDYPYQKIYVRKEPHLYESSFFHPDTPNLLQFFLPRSQFVRPELLKI